MTQLRIPFSDYPPEEQERDAARAKRLKEIMRKKRYKQLTINFNGGQNNER